MAPGRAARANAKDLPAMSPFAKLGEPSPSRFRLFMWQSSPDIWPFFGYKATPTVAVLP